MSPSTASEVSIDVVPTAETNHPIFFKQVVILLLGAAATLGDMVMPPALTVVGFFKQGFILLLGAAEQLDDDVNHAIHHNPIVFILGSLIGFAGVKAQGDPHFPFKTHNILIKISITSLLFFGIASATQPEMSRQVSSVCQCSRMDHMRSNCGRVCICIMIGCQEEIKPIASSDFDYQIMYQLLKDMSQMGWH